MGGIRAVTIRDMQTDEVKKTFKVKPYGPKRLSVDVKEGAVIINERRGCGR